MTSYDIARLKQEDADSVARLLSDHYKSPTGELGRQVRAICARPESVVMAATIGQKLVGCQVYAYWPVSVGGVQHDAYQSCHSLVLPEAQGAGLFRRLLAAGRACIPDERSICFGFPNSASCAAFIKDGWAIVSERRRVVAGRGAAGAVVAKVAARRFGCTVYDPPAGAQVKDALRVRALPSLYPYADGSLAHTQLAGLPLRRESRARILSHVVIGVDVGRQPDDAVTQVRRTGLVQSWYEEVPLSGQGAGKNRLVVVARPAGDNQGTLNLDFSELGFCAADTW